MLALASPLPPATRSVCSVRPALSCAGSRSRRHVGVLPAGAASTSRPTSDVPKRNSGSLRLSSGMLAFEGTCMASRGHVRQIQPALPGILPLSTASAARRSSVISLALACDAQPATGPVRLRLHNLSPQPGSRKKRTRVGRGHGSKGGSSGRGMKGQRARSGGSVRIGFEGGQTPFYRRFPKLRGAGRGMNAAQKYVAVNLRQLARFEPHERVTIEKLKHVGVVHATGRERNLPLKVLGTGDISRPLTIEAASVSAAARSKIEAAGGTIVELPAKVKWTRAAHELRQKDMLKALERLAGTDADETSDDGE